MKRVAALVLLQLALAADRDLFRDDLPVQSTLRPGSTAVVVDLECPGAPVAEQEASAAFEYPLVVSEFHALAGQEVDRKGAPRAIKGKKICR